MITGTKYCKNAFDLIIKSSFVNETEGQCLYLVADTKTDAVMLHNGKQQLGIVGPPHVQGVRKLLDNLSTELGVDQVLVCRAPRIFSNEENRFRSNSSFTVAPCFSVNERLARKFSDKYRKE